MRFAPIVLTLVWCLVTGVGARRDAVAQVPSEGGWLGELLELPDTAAPPLPRRLAIADSIVASVQRWFPHRDVLTDVDVPAVVRKYRHALPAADTRRRFALATSVFLAHFRNGHTSLRDAFLERHSGGPLPFSVRSIPEGWIAHDSRDARVPDGSVIEQINGVPAETFYERRRPFLFASTERAARQALFARGGMETTHLLPLRLEFGLQGGRRVVVERSSSPEGAGIAGRDRLRVVGRWLDSGVVGYVRIPGFSPYEHRRRAEELVRSRFHDAPALVLDVRGTWGGATPSDLIRALMDRPWPWWTGDTLHPRAGSDPYRGVLALLVDAGCVSACEDFVMPFRWNGRATVIGQQTAGSSGQPAVLTFAEGLEVWVARRVQRFPDGRPFEGVGITPHILVTPTSVAFRSGADPGMGAAVAAVRRELARRSARPRGDPPQRAGPFTPSRLPRPDPSPGEDALPPFLVILTMLTLQSSVLERPALASAPPQGRRIANLEAFARLYGYVRFFHPSDEAAALDWDRFAVYGARHDGSQHHLVGILPTVPATRTLAGIRAGRDEMLEVALDVVRERR